jgi:hypothetical protein
MIEVLKPANGRQTLFAPVLVPTSCKLPLELAFTTEPGANVCPYTVTANGMPMVLVQSSQLLPMVAVPGEIAPVAL